MTDTMSQYDVRSSWTGARIMVVTAATPDEAINTVLDAQFRHASAADKDVMRPILVAVPCGQLP